MNQDNKRNKKDKKQKWKPNNRNYQQKKQSSNHYNHHSNSNNNNNNNNYHNQYNDYNGNQYYDNQYDNHYHNHNNYHNNKNRFESNSYNTRNHKYKSYNQNNSRSTIIRAPIEECNNQFMKQINEQNNNDTVGIQQFRYRTWPNLGWQESESLTVGNYFYSQFNTNYQTWKKPKELINNNNYEETFKDYPWKNQVDFLESNSSSKQNISIEPFTVSTNTFPIQLNTHINVLEYEINIKPKSDNQQKNDSSRSNSNMDTLDKLFKKYDKKRVVKNSFDPYVIEENTGTLFTFNYDKNKQEYEEIIKFPEHFDDENIYSFRLSSIHSLHFYAGMENDSKNNDNDDEEDQVSPERRKQIFQCILSSILLKTGFTYVNFGPSRGWYPANQNENLNNVCPVYMNPKSAQLRQIGVIRGFRASIDTSANGVALKVSNTNKIVHVETLANELQDLYHSDPKAYKHNVSRFIGRKALYLPTQKVIDITEIQIDKNEHSTFITKRNGKNINISHKDNLLARGVVSNIYSEKYGLVGNKHDFSFLPQFMHLLFDQHDLSKKQCKDALIYLSKNVDHELKSVNYFVKHIINIQNKEKEKDNMILSLISISNKAYETNAYPLPSVSIAFKLNDKEFKNCNELLISSEWKNIGGIIIEPMNGRAKTLLVGASLSVVKKVKSHVENYLKRRKFGSLLFKEIDNFVPKDIWKIDELKNKLIKNEYELLIFILPNISDGSKLKRKVHRMCLELGIKSQCISDEVFYDTSHSKQRNVVWGMCSDIVYKLGATSYKILPNILEINNNNNKININNTLVMGLDICHPTRIKSTNRPSIAVMTSLYGNIMTPNIGQQKNSLFLNNNRQEICGYKSTIEMCKNILSQQLLRNDIFELPKIIIFCRDGVSDSQIPQMVSKELTALLLSIRKIKKMNEIKLKFDKKIVKEWKPKIEWIVIQKRILDRFSCDKNTKLKIKLNTHSPTFIVPSDIVSGKYFEFYLEIGKRSPKRIIFIKDDLNLRKNGIIEIAQFLYATHWLYPPCIPFQMGPLNVPVTIKFSDHYASMWQDMLTYNDNDINDVKTNINLHNPQIVIVEKN